MVSHCEGQQNLLHFPFVEFHGSYTSQLLLAACTLLTPLVAVRPFPYIKAAGFILKL